MSLKKKIGLIAGASFAAASLVVATPAMAGGPDIAPVAPDYSGFYADFDIGYAESDWAHFVGGIFNPTGGAASPGSVTSNGNGFTYGGDIGYQFNQYFSFEVGAYDLEDARGDAGNSAATSSTIINTIDSTDQMRLSPPEGSPGPVTVESWILYAAAKLSIPLFQNLDMFGKVGIGWRFLDYSGPGIDSLAARQAGVRQSFNNQHYATLLAGAGLQYWFTPNWSFNVQYLYLPGYNKADELAQQSPNVHLIVAGIGYKFNV